MFKPLGNNIIIKKISEEVKNKSGIILVSNSEDRERNDIGEVIAVSDNANELKVGQKVIYSKYAGSTLKQDGEDYLIIDFDDILALVED
jgi:chaperonin GroES